MPEQPPFRDEILGAVARGWCHEDNAHKEMDSELALAICSEVMAVLDTAEPWLGLATTARLLEELTVRAEVGGYARYRTVGPEEIERAPLEIAT